MEYLNKIFNADGLTGMDVYPDKSIDLILCDMPYGMTNCKWDKSAFSLPYMWRQYERIIKDNGAIVLTAAQPFTTDLINSNRKLFRYCWYWRKNMTTGFTFAKFQPLRCMEDICVFYKKAPTYNPQGIIYHEKPIVRRGRKDNKSGDFIYDADTLRKDTVTHISNYPRNILDIKCERGLHPTQKPVELFEYLIRTYTNEGDIVLDNCMGSGTTAVAAIRSGRNYTGFELDEGYYKTATERAARELNRYSRSE